MEAKDNGSATKPRHRMKVLPGKPVRIRGRMFSTLRFVIEEERSPRFAVPVSEISMACDPNHEEAVIKNLQRLKRIPE